MSDEPGSRHPTPARTPTRTPDPVAGASGGEAHAGVGGAVRAGDGAAVVALAADALDQAILSTVRDVHRAVSDRAFRLTPGSWPVQVVHDRLTDLVYASVRAGIGLAALTGSAVITARGRGDGWLDADPARSAAWAIAHGVIGDRIADDHPDLDLPVRIRVGARDVRATPQTLGRAFPAPSRRVAVFLHGLTESDRAWDAPRGHRGPEEPPRPDAIVLPEVVAELGWTPVRLRYGTGRAIGRNGTELAELLDALCAAWPQEVDELVLVGHSMGGLVARSAIVHGQREGHTWVERVGHTVNLGVPHLGSWLERTASRGTWLARRLPEAAAFGRIIDLRARGIKDLRYGALDDASWGEGVFDEDGVGDLDRPLPPPTEDPPLLDGAVHHLIAGRLHPSPRHPLTRLFGDLLVHPASALGDDGCRQLQGARIEQLEVASSHFGMLHDTAVAEHLRTWLA